MELPEQFRVLDHSYQVRARKTWNTKTNFTMVLTGEVQHPQDTVYLAHVTRDDGVQGNGHFALCDTYKAKDLASALNRSTVDGGLLCHLNNQDMMHLIRFLIKDLKARVPMYRKELVKVAGTQEGTGVMILNPQEYVDLATEEVKPLDDSPFVWMCRFSPRSEYERHIATPPSIEPLSAFLDQAQVVLGDAFGVAVLAWSALYSLNIYRWTVDQLRHFNLPVLYGDPMVGKTLIASCGAWLNGCPRTAIASRCTLSFVTSMVTASTFPFIWDDPSTADEVTQLAVDLGNSAVRGKGTEEPRVPATGCLVTANFNMAESLKYFSRILLLKVERSSTGKTAGKARELETLAQAASSSFPMVMGMLHRLEVDDVHRETQQMQTRLDADIRIVEGISLPIHIAKKILHLCKREHMIHAVEEYVAEKLLPYYRHVMPVEPEPSIAMDQRDVISIEHITRTSASLIKGGTVLAVTYDVVSDVDKVKAIGGRLNKSTKFCGKVKKMIHLPKMCFTPDKWTMIYAKMTTREQPTEESNSPIRDSPIREQPNSPIRDSPIREQPNSPIRDSPIREQPNSPIRDSPIREQPNSPIRDSPIREQPNSPIRDSPIREQPNSPIQDSPIREQPNSPI